MKIYTLILVSLFVLFVSCKSQKDVSRKVVNQTSAESLVTISDSLKTHLETSATIDAVRVDDSIKYEVQTDFDTEGNITRIIETLFLFNSRLDFKSQLDEIKRGDFKYTSVTQLSDTTSTTLDENINETSDSQLIQGWEWAIVIFAIAAVLLILYFVFIKRH